MTKQNSDIIAPPLPLGWRGLTLLLLLTAAVVVACYWYVDVPAARWARYDLPRWVRDVADWVSLLGRADPYLVPLAIAAVWYGVKRKWWSNPFVMMFAQIAIAGLSSNLFKFILARHRPNMLHKEGEYGFEWFSADYSQNSFPSGHTTTVAAAVVVLWLWLPRWRVAWVLLLLAVGVSRVLDRAHYPGDVFGGVTLAIVMTFAVQRLFLKMRWITSSPPEQPPELPPEKPAEQRSP
jgi:membrane-associated phospholipid phosphatase